MTTAVAKLAAAIEAGESVVALTGAGVSTASGIPDFRSEGGIWDKYDPSEFHYSKFKADPGSFWEKRIELYDEVYGDNIEPNSAHESLATLEKRGQLDGLVTQNIDGLHEQAGSSAIEVHGNGRRVACEGCGQKLPFDPVRERVLSGELPPTCESCAGILKPDVVLFGEQLPRAPLQQAKQFASTSDVFLAVGSSLTVEPAASLPRIADRNGATLAVINLEETPVSEQAAFDIRGDVTDILPAIVDAMATA